MLSLRLNLTLPFWCIFCAHFTFIQKIFFFKIKLNQPINEIKLLNF